MLSITSKTKAVSDVQVVAGRYSMASESQNISRNKASAGKPRTSSLAAATALSHRVELFEILACIEPLRSILVGEAEYALHGAEPVERAIGDFGVEKGLALKRLTDEKKSQKVAVIGAGLSGLILALAKYNKDIQDPSSRTSDLEMMKNVAFWAASRFGWQT